MKSLSLKKRVQHDGPPNVVFEGIVSLLLSTLRPLPAIKV